MSTHPANEKRAGHSRRRSPLAWLAIGMIRLYQIVLAPILPPACRFTPTCSAYTLEAIRKYGFFKGSWLGVRRIVRCNPWHPGGEDPVP
jgi:putative membrane protein insertion efficiency factor